LYYSQDRLHKAGMSQESQAPHQHTAQLGPLPPAHHPVRHGVHQRHIAVRAHQNHEVDAAVGVDLDAQDHQGAHEGRKGPIEAMSHVDRPEGQAGHQDQVGCRQVAEVDLGDRARRLVEAEH
uniref:Uncharacterized protein n=1 Tax=Gadus morhua TaxID=8049 RepID=A0A8C5BAN0_GADMO